jgi:hypothetical protein
MESEVLGNLAVYDEVAGNVAVGDLVRQDTVPVVGVLSALFDRFPIEGLVLDDALARKRKLLTNHINTGL